MKMSFLLPAVLTAALFIQCSDKGADPQKRDRTPKPVDLTIAEKAVVQSSNTFGLKLFKEIVSGEPESANVFISPLSVSMALGMTLNGADGATKDAMQSTMALSGQTDQQINESYKNLLTTLTQLDPSVKFQIANAIFYRLGLPVADPFVYANQTYFDAAVRGLDFYLPEAADTINGWVDKNTNGKIKDIVRKPIDSGLVMFLLNAVYFKGDWTVSFDPENTGVQAFQAPGNPTFTCKMMHAKPVAPYLETHDFAVLDLPYGDGNFSMTLFLPLHGVSVDSVLKTLTPEKYSSVLTQLTTDSVIVGIPKFKLEYKVGLKPILSAMGMSVAFNPLTADFTRMVTQGNCFISDARHKTFVDVNEVGTEAAAVTVIEMGPTAIRDERIFIADRPFIFVIRENVSQTILFMGRIARPEYQ
jgi:serine protease inhibitor